MGGRIGLERGIMSTIDHIGVWLLQIFTMKQAVQRWWRRRQRRWRGKAGRCCVCGVRNAWLEIYLTYGQDPDGVDSELVGLCVTHLDRLFFEIKKWSVVDGWIERLGKKLRGLRM